ncbi:NfeD family protein, partial [Xanthomonas perforans]|nr:NfeD family protein [Xanthomonas perforans]
MRWDVAVWAMLALLLIAAETLVPGAFLLWMGIAAAAVCVLVLVLPNIALLWQIVAFVLLSIVSVQVYRAWFRGNGRQR